MKALNITLHHLSNSMLVLILATLFTQMAYSQRTDINTDDLLSIAKPGNPKGWIDIRDNINIPPTSIFTDYKKLFKLDTDDEMRIRIQKTDKIGMTHYKYNQYYRGYRIDGTDVIVHERNGRTQSLNGNMVVGMNQDANPVLSEESALNAALKSMGNVRFLWEDEEAQHVLRDAEHNPDTTWYPRGELVWSRSNGDDEFTPNNFSLCWKFEVRTTSEYGDSKRVFVNATTGDIVRKIAISFTCSAGTGNTTWYGNQNISTKNQDFSSDFELNDNCTDSHDYKIHTKNKNNGNGTDEYEDADNSWVSSGDLDGVTTHWCLHRTLDYYSDVQGRNSYDDNGHDVDAYNNALFNGVNGTKTKNNACWGCSGNVLDFGDGPTTSATDDYNSMEAVGHEFTHGVTQESAGLEYEKQSGALNESFSDIFGTVIENWTGAGTFDWTIGEEFVTPFLRNMANPTADGVSADTYKGTNWITTISCSPTTANDQCGVHTNSGVQNFFFYLLSVGGSGTNDNGDAYSVTGIGIDDAADIAYRALTVYLTSTSAYQDARESWIRAANDLFGSCSAEALAVGNAWYAVGVGPDVDYYDVTVCGNIFPIIADLKYNAINSVTAAGSCVTTIGQGPNSVTFEATNSIVLGDGFLAPEGSIFYAFIDPCNISYWEKIASEDTPDQYNEPEASDHAEINNPLHVEIAPSPFASSFQVSISMTPKQSLQLDLYDITGKMLKTIFPKQLIQDGHATVNVDGSDLAGGIYIVKGFAGEEVICERIIKVK